MTICIHIRLWQWPCPCTSSLFEYRSPGHLNNNLSHALIHPTPSPHKAISFPWPGPTVFIRTSHATSTNASYWWGNWKFGVRTSCSEVCYRCFRIGHKLNKCSFPTQFNPVSDKKKCDVVQMTKCLYDSIVNHQGSCIMKLIRGEHLWLGLLCRFIDHSV